MPVLRFKPGRVEEALGLSLDKALQVMERLKIEVELDDEGNVIAELEVDRPDMYSLEGIARQAKGLLGLELGMPNYEIVESGYRIVAEDVPTRPYVAGAVVWDVDVDEDFLEELIQFQEKLHTSHGGQRRRVAIGLHDLDKLPSRNVFYRFMDVDKVVFKPLHHEREMTLREVLEETSQGKSYGSISLQDGKHPVLFSGEEVISVPPVINADLTRIEPGTRHIFIDVTGPELKPVLDILSILAANLAERSKSKKIGIVDVEAPWGKLREPSLEPATMTLYPEYASRVIGTSITADDTVEALKRMRFGARKASASRVEVEVPRYRVDILHPVDLVEEIALAIGLDRLAPEKPRLMLRGSLLPVRAWEREARLILVGHGFVEVYSYSLTSCKDQIELAGIDEKRLVVIENPVGVESECYRASLLPQLLRIAAANQHAVPLRVFEIGDVIVASEEDKERGIAYQRRVALLYMGEKAGYEDIQSVVYSVLRLLGDEIAEVKPTSHRLFIEGRTAELRTRRGVVAVLGEVKPEILEKLGITYPIAAAELDYTALQHKWHRPPA
ncbi:phenylalanine--tRNA ligase subunit beta [Pyrodictium abyssi]|uniref:phenylalanine--tRNA ligase n=1 Tax=Pyrodictium abyssi TaxID=54256 RepID=A0ABM8IYS4_9CREN|nr:phenylalanine--tRNA ligase subunit beta [Pyrodictium abyssi]